MKGLTSSLWPIHYKPLPDELLSCWLVRLAHGHGLKAQTFCNLIFGSGRQVWNRDIDRLAPEWLIEELCYRTGTSSEIAWNTTLRAYEGLLYRRFKISGALPWILALKIYHRKREGYGLQFCPTCLAQDDIPYFRKRWRVAFNTVCAKHGTMLMDRCPKCASTIAVHRLDISRPTAIEEGVLSHCYACGFDLREAIGEKPISYERNSSKLLLDISFILESDSYDLDLGKSAVMHQLCRLLTDRSKHVHLRQFVQGQVGAQNIRLTDGHVSFEMRSLAERHHLMQLTAWIVLDMEERLHAAWVARAIRYNVLLKDFPEPPDWYLQIVGNFANWRERLNFLE